MQAGPLRRTIAIIGLIALTPTMLFTALGQLSAAEAAVRAVITFLVVVLLGRTVAMSLRFYVHFAERAGAERSQRRRAGDDDA